jgi:hypothetical protein
MEIQLRAVRTIIHIAAVALILLSFIVSIPLTIITYQDNGGLWAFGIIGLPILIPLSFYLLFGVAGLIRHEHSQRRWFVVALVTTFLAGVATLIILPVYPIALALVPLILSVLGMVSRSRYKYYLIIMLCLGIVANIMLLKWEIDFDRQLPVIQLFSSRASAY